MTPNLHGATLPANWRAEQYGRTGNDEVTIERVDPSAKFSGGSVTINFKRRIFSGGSSSPYFHKGTSTYAGRNWKKQIIEDACEWLEKEMTS